MSIKAKFGGSVNSISGLGLLRRAQRAVYEAAAANWPGARARLRRRILAVSASALGVCLASLSISASADVTGGVSTLVYNHVVPTDPPSLIAEARLTLNSPVVPIYSLNGEIAYDAALFQPPAVLTDEGSAGFLAEGHLVEPGAFRFIIYDDASPIPGAMNLALPVLRFIFTRIDGNPPPRLTQIQFTLSEAATLHPSAGAVSIEAGGAGGTPPPMTVEFAPFFAHLQQGSRANDWAFYE